MACQQRAGHGSAFLLAFRQVTLATTLTWPPLPAASGMCWRAEA